MIAVALNSLLVFINPSHLLGSIDSTVYLGVVGHTHLSEMQEKSANQLQADIFLVYSIFQYLPVTNEFMQVWNDFLLHDQGWIAPGNLRPDFQPVQASSA